MHSNDGKALVAEASIPAFNERQSVTTVVAAESPEIDEHDATPQVLEL